jgi:hypothetical protein
MKSDRKTPLLRTVWGQDRRHSHHGLRKNTRTLAARRYALDLSDAEFAYILERLAPIRTMPVFGLNEIENNPLFNTAIVVNSGQLMSRYRKTQLRKGKHAAETGLWLVSADAPGQRNQSAHAESIAP